MSTVNPVSTSPVTVVVLDPEELEKKLTQSKQSTSTLLIAFIIIVLMYLYIYNKKKKEKEASSTNTTTGSSSKYLSPINIILNDTKNAIQKLKI